MGSVNLVFVRRICTDSAGSIVISREYGGSIIIPREDGYTRYVEHSGFAMHP